MSAMRRTLRAASVRSEASNGSSFVTNVMSVLERVEYRFCESGEDLEAIYRLRYESYHKAGMIPADVSKMVYDRFDELPNCYRYGVFFDGELVSTIRVHHATADHPISPSTVVFEDVLEARLAAGESFIDPSRLAADAEWSASLRVLPYITLRLGVVACRHFEPTSCLTAIREEHAAFYRRIFRSTSVVEARIYPGLTMPVHLYEAPVPESANYAETRFPFFRSTASERRMLFERPKSGETAPLTILPTAKYLLDAA